MTNPNLLSLFSLLFIFQNLFFSFQDCFVSSCCNEKKNKKSEFFFFISLSCSEKEKEECFFFPFPESKAYRQNSEKVVCFFFFNLTAPNCISVTKFAFLTPNFAGATFHSYFLLTLC